MHLLSINKAPPLWRYVGGCEVKECMCHSEKSCRYLSSGDTNFIFEKESLTGLKLINNPAPGWPASPGNPLPVPTFVVLGFQACSTLYVHISMDTGGPSSGSCLCVTSPLLTEPFPQPKEMYLLKSSLELDFKDLYITNDNRIFIFPY